MNYDFSDSILDDAFDAVEEYVHSEIREDEFTARMMAEKHGTYTRKHWRTKLKQAAEDGVLESRTAKLANGRNGLAFRVAEGEDFEGAEE